MELTLKIFSAVMCSYEHLWLIKEAQRNNRIIYEVFVKIRKIAKGYLDGKSVGTQPDWIVF